MVIEVVLVPEGLIATGAGQVLFFAMLSDHVALNISYLPGLVATNTTVPH